MPLLEYEGLIRLGCFASVLAVFAVAERLAPRRRQKDQCPRQLNNLGLALLNAVAARLLIPVGALGTALLAETRGWGLFNNVQVPVWAAVILSVLVLDAAIYLQHVLFHAVPVLWRLHRVHHAARELDVTAGARFHTVEILLSAFLKMGVVILLGPPAGAVLLFEVLLNATSMFNHSNLRLPLWLDRVLRLVLVTPDMHRVHHSLDGAETNSNFGFNLPWWDYLLGTYRAQPAAGHEGMRLGVRGWEAPAVERLPFMLAMPFLPAPHERPAETACLTAPRPAP